MNIPLSDHYAHMQESHAQIKSIQPSVFTVDGARSMMALVAAQSTPTSGLSVRRAMDGLNGVTSGTSTSTRMAMASSRGRPGGRASMGTGGTAPGVSSTTGLGGCTSMGAAAVASTGTRTSRRTRGTSGSRTLGSTTALRTRRSSGP